MLDKYVTEFTNDELLCTLDIIEAVRPYCKTKRQKEKLKMCEYKFNYWVMISRIKGNSSIRIGDN